MAVDLVKSLLGTLSKRKIQADMKTCVQIITLLTVFCSLATAQVKIPRKAFGIKEIEKAKSVAQEKGKPLIFVDTWLGLAWGSTFVVGAATFESFKSVGVFVLMDHRSKVDKYKGKLPANLRSSVKGNTSPLVVLTDPTGTKPLMGFSATGNNAKSVKKLAREFKKKLKQNPELLTEGVTPQESESSASQDEDIERELLAESQTWSNSAGKEINAAVISVSETHVVFLMKGDKEVSYPLAKLSDESREKLIELQWASAPSKQGD